MENIDINFPPRRIKFIDENFSHFRVFVIGPHTLADNSVDIGLSEIKEEESINELKRINLEEGNVSEITINELKINKWINSSS